MSKLTTWTCTKCNSTQTADSRQRWTMSYCKCGLSYVDAEEHYTREGGYVKIENIKDVNDIKPKNR